MVVGISVYIYIFIYVHTHTQRERGWEWEPKIIQRFFAINCNSLILVLTLIQM